MWEIGSELILSIVFTWMTGDLSTISLAMCGARSSGVKSSSFDGLAGVETARFNSRVVNIALFNCIVKERRLSNKKKIYISIYIYSYFII